MDSRNTTLDLCNKFWRNGDPRFWQTLSKKQSAWLLGVATNEGVDVRGSRAAYVGSKNEFLARRFYLSELIEIKKDI